jgi:hypothetical protein
MCWISSEKLLPGDGITYSSTEFACHRTCQARNQGDRIGRIFACVLWAVFCENLRSFSNYSAAFSHAKNGLAYFFGDFFHKLIGSPCQGHCQRKNGQGFVNNKKIQHLAFGISSNDDSLYM